MDPILTEFGGGLMLRYLKVLVVRVHAKHNGAVDAGNIPCTINTPFSTWLAKPPEMAFERVIQQQQVLSSLT